MHEHGLEEGASLLEVAVDVLQDAALDTLYLIPFLLVTYLVMEWLEHHMGEKSQRAIQRAGVAGPAIGAVLGAVPQCGFSAAASTLYAGRVVTLGTLFAVYLSTSDEMLPIFIAEQVPLGTLFAVVGSKVAIGMAAGFAIDAVLRMRRKEAEAIRIHDLCEQDHCHCEDGEGAGSGHDHGHDHNHGGAGAIVKSAVIHTLQVTLFVFLISLALNIVFAVVGEHAIESFLGSHGVLAVIGSGVVGLIPNCAASVAIAQLYVDGVLSTGAMMAGLLSAAGVGLLVLLRSNRPAKQNAYIVAALWGIGVVCGLVIDALGIVM